MFDVECDIKKQLCAHELFNGLHILTSHFSEIRYMDIRRNYDQNTPLS